MTRPKSNAFARIFAALGRVAPLQELKALGTKALRAISEELRKGGRNNANEIEDVFQDALLSICKHFGKGRKPKSVSAYFLTVCRNAARRHLKKEIRVERAQKELSQALQGEIFLPQRPLARERVLFLSALGSLSDRSRLIIKLMYIEELDTEALCAFLDCTKGALRTRAYRARNELREALRREVEKERTTKAEPRTGGNGRNCQGPRRKVGQDK